MPHRIISNSGNMKLVHWPLMGELLRLVPSAKEEVTAHPSTASIPITILLYNAPLLCCFNVPTKGLKGNNKS